MLGALRWGGVVAGCAVLLAAPGPAAADKVAAAKHAADATALAKKGDFVGAIALYKKADASSPDPEQRCRIGLAYVRLEKWHQAHLYLFRCRSEWTAARADAMPSWVARREREVAGKVRGGTYRALSVATDPAGAWVSSSAHAADEWLPPGAVLWVPVGGKVTLRARHSDGTIVELADYEVTDARAASVTIAPAPEPPAVADPKEPVKTALEPKKTPPRAAPEPSPDPIANPQPGTPDPTTITTVVTERDTPSRTVPLAITIAGGVFLAAGATAHVLAVGKRKDAEELPPGPQNDPEFDRLQDAFSTRRNIAIGAYAVGAVGVGVGLYLLLTQDSGAAQEAPITGYIGPDGAGVHATVATW